MKRPIFLFSISLTVASIVGCGPEPPPPEATTPQASAPEMKTAPAHGMTPPAAEPQLDFSGIAKPEGGVTVAELYAERDKLSGKEVVVRGKVVKFLSRIMGKNWVHVRDGTGAGDAKPATNDLTVTTDATVKVGDTVLVRGKALLDKDYGYGYKYAVIIEDAKVTAE